MALYKGSNQIGKLYKGDELVTRVFKGDELIYRDIEALYGFKFTVDTSKTNKQLKMNFNNQPGTLQQYVRQFYVIIDWGDGTKTRTTMGTWPSHTYSVAGVYQVMILPDTFINGRPKKGWLSPFIFGTSINSNVNSCLISIDTKYPEDSLYIYRYSGSNPPSMDNFIYRTAAFGWGGYTDALLKIESYPLDLVDNMVVVNELTDNYENFARYAFYGFGRDGGADPLPLFRATMAKFDLSQAKNLKKMFDSTFAGAGFYATTGKIPSDLFRMLDGIKPTNVVGMFYNTFSGTLARSTEWTIPADLFPHLDTSEIEDFTQMFYGTFQYGSSGGYVSQVATIPEGLFDFLDMSSAKVTQQMFAGTFGQCCVASKVSTIPDGLFDCVDTSNCTDVSSMFSGTFLSTFQNSTVASIPQGLFDGVDTSNATNATGLFQSTFGSCFSKVQGGVTVPTDLFDGVDLTNCTSAASLFDSTFNGSKITNAPVFPTLNTGSCTSFYRMFYGTFASSSIPTIPANLFSGVDTTNGVNFESMFERIFYACTTPTTLPATLFSFLDTSNGTNFRSMFNYAFYNCCYYGTAGIPAGLFDSLDMTNATDTYRMFYQAFYRFEMQGTAVRSLPSGLFAKVNGGTTSSEEMFYATFAGMYYYSPMPQTPLVISGDIFPTSWKAGANAKGMFNSTFSEFSKGPSTTISTGLFAGLDTSSTTNFQSMFEQTFGYLKGGLTTIPSDLFSYLDTTSGTNFQSMFYNTFKSTPLANVPAGLFASVDTSGATLANCRSLFIATFDRRDTSSSSPDVLLEDIFAGMPSFNWFDSTSQYWVPRLMFNGANIWQKFSGSASTVIFRFPQALTYNSGMFFSQDHLTDYATIDDSWKKL